MKCIGESWKPKAYSLIKTRAPPLKFSSRIWLTAVQIMSLLSMFWDHLICFQYYHRLRTLNTLTTFKKFINPLLSKFLFRSSHRSCSAKKVSLKFCKNHRKMRAPESLF